MAMYSNTHSNLNVLYEGERGVGGGLCVPVTIVGAESGLTAEQISHACRDQLLWSVHSLQFQPISALSVDGDDGSGDDAGEVVGGVAGGGSVEGTAAGVGMPTSCCCFGSSCPSPRGITVMSIEG